MIEYVILIALILGAGYWIIRPLLQPDAWDRTQLEIQKAGVYSTIQELEFDLKMGKLTPDDFEALKRQYKNEAIDCIKAIEDLKTDKKEAANLAEEDLEDQIEQEIVAMRANRSKENAHIFCSQCGTKSARQDRFCFSCGAKLAHPQLHLSHG
jgi:hypothetical protein